VVAELASQLPGKVVILHHRPGVLPRRSAMSGPLTNPHALEPYGPLRSSAKVFYLWLDYLLGWVVRIRPALEDGATVLLERGWWDLAVDPRRYRLRASQGLVRALGRLLPAPDRTLILTGSPETIIERKPELPVEELTRQIGAWRELPHDLLHAVVIEVDAPLQVVSAMCIQALAAGESPPRSMPPEGS
jgi:hypothetical protein